MEDTSEFKTLVVERFKKLPKVVQKAITSADVSQHMRALATTHKLHLDQWESLENEVQYTLLGIQPAEELAKNIQKEVGVDETTAAALAADISKVVFEPIRKELERELEHPDATAAITTGVEDVRAQALATSQPAASAPVVPATPPPAPNTIKVERAPVSPSYAPKVASHERKTVDGDPYREQLL